MKKKKRETIQGLSKHEINNTWVTIQSNQVELTILTNFNKF
jgi:hypothetical protein